VVSKSNRADCLGFCAKRPLPGSLIKGFPSLLFLVSLMGGCATTVSESAPPTEPLRWPVGEYLLEGTVEYRRDTKATVRTVQADYSAEVDVLADGTMNVSAPSGPCRESPSGGVRQGRVPRQRTFWCGDVSYVLKPVSGTIGGEVHVWVIEAVQRQGLCRKTGIVNGLQVCVDYPLEVSEQPVDKTAVLNVVEKVPSPASLGPSLVPAPG